MIYFFSDVHLGLFERNKEIERENLLVKFLEAISEDCQKLFIVGDLFDFWFDFKTVIPRNFFRTISSLYKLKTKGIEIFYFMGNHDFGHYNFFETELGIPVIPNDLEIVLSGKKFFISHGDGKIPNDYGYFFLKKILRNRIAQKLYRFIHPDIGIWLASHSSKKSRYYSQHRNPIDVDPLFEFAKTKIEEGFDFVVMGHSHHVSYINHQHGIYVNLGDWFAEPMFARFNGDSIALMKVKEYTNIVG